MTATLADPVLQHSGLSLTQSEGPKPGCLKALTVLPVVLTNYQSKSLLWKIPSILLMHLQELPASVSPLQLRFPLIQKLFLDG
jgi:hypothetical protein